MKWEKQTTPAIEQHAIESGDCTLRVEPHGGLDGRPWRFFSMTFGSTATEDVDECLESWPREAIAKARKELDELEAKLEAE